MQQRASIGEKFFESSKHSGDLKKMKKRLGETADFHMKYCSGTVLSTTMFKIQNLSYYFLNIKRPIIDNMSLFQTIPQPLLRGGGMLPIKISICLCPGGYYAKVSISL